MLKIALALALAVPASAAPDPSFEQSLDASAVLGQARAAVKTDASVVARHRVGSMRYDVDCATLRFGPDGRTSSDVVYLQSREWIEECYYEPYPGCDPRYNNCQPYYRCYERPGYTYRQNVQVILQSRQPLRPWEYDSFQVCLQGPWSDIRNETSAYAYKQVAGGGREGSFVMAPGQKLAMAPDPNGIALESLSSALVLALKDKWASYYAGEKTALTLVVKRRNPNWFPKKIATVTVTLPAADAYKVNLLDYAAQFSQQPAAGRQYFVQASFQRIGKISSAAEVDMGESEDATYQPGGTALGK